MTKTVSRRKFIRSAGLTLAALPLASYAFASDTGRAKIKAIAFDAFPVFDPGPVFKMVHERYPENGKQLTELWKTKQFTYQWLRATGNRYKDFTQTTADALAHAALACGVTLPETEQKTIMNAYEKLSAWPDVIPALEQLRKEQLSLCFLSNMNSLLLQKCIRNSGLETYFNHILTSDAVNTYKPSPVMYQLGVDTLNLKKEEILFVAFAGWDVAGAKWFGYPVFWVNRSGAVPEQLDAAPDGVGKNLTDLVQFVRTYNKE